jgi:hypothetical protein
MRLSTRGHRRASEGGASNSVTPKQPGAFSLYWKTVTHAQVRQQPRIASGHRAWCRSLASAQVDKRAKHMLSRYCSSPARQLARHFRVCILPHGAVHCSLAWRSTHAHRALNCALIFQLLLLLRALEGPNEAPPCLITRFIRFAWASVEGPCLREPQSKLRPELGRLDGLDVRPRRVSAPNRRETTQCLSPSH